MYFVRCYVFNCNWCDCAQTQLAADKLLAQHMRDQHKF